MMTPMTAKVMVGMLMKVVGVLLMKKDNQQQIQRAERL